MRTAYAGGTARRIACGLMTVCLCVLPSCKKSPSSGPIPLVWDQGSWERDQWGADPAAVMLSPSSLEDDFANAQMPEKKELAR